MSDYPLVPFVEGETGDPLIEHFNTEFQAVGDGVTAAETEFREATDALHGQGIIHGLTLSIGTGLTARVTAGGAGVDDYLLAGQLYPFTKSGGYDVVDLPASEVNYIYQDAAGDYTLYEDAKPSPEPEDAYCLGQATTDGSACTAVDQTEADYVSSVAGTAGDIAALKTAVGIPYVPLVNLDDRVATLEAAPGGGTPAYWRGLQKTAGDATTIEQEIETRALADIAAALADLPSGGATGANVLVEQWDVDANNQAIAAMNLGYLGVWEVFVHQLDCVTVIDDYEGNNIWGHGANGGPDWVDPDSDW